MEIIENKENIGNKKNKYCCEKSEVHLDIIEKVNKTLPDEEHLYDLADLFKVFGDSTRIKILYTLFQDSMCVCDIAQVLEMTQSAISHQLKILKQAKLVKYKREGKQVIYSLADNHIYSILVDSMEHIME